MIRIAHIDTETGWRGGENQLFLLALGLREKGHENLIIAQPDSALARKAKAEGFETAEIRMRGEWDLLARLRVAAATRRFEADLVHAHTAHGHAMGLGAVGGALGPKRLVVSRRVDFPMSAHFFSRRKYLSPRCRYIAISQGVATALREGGVPPERIDIVHSGIDPKRFTFQKTERALRKQMGFGDDLFVVGNLAALTDHKGHIYLLEAAANVLKKTDQVRFVVAGEGELRESLERRKSQLGLDNRFYFVGHRTDVEDCLNGFDLFALSSHLEGLCTSVIDAMMLGVPVVAARAGGVPDLVIHEETGLLAPPRDADALAAAILRMIDDKTLRQRMAAKAKQRVIENFTARNMVNGIVAVYENILKNSDGADGEKG